MQKAKNDTNHDRSGSRDRSVPGRVAVTGATGLLGSQLTLRLLAEGYPAIVLLVRDASRLESLRKTLEREGITWDDNRLIPCEVALNDPAGLREALRGVDTVFHCAAQVSLSDDGAAELIETNVEMTAHVVDAAMDCGVGLLVHVSSIAALDGKAHENEGSDADGLIDETSNLESLANTSPYGVSKFLSENEVWRGSALGLRVVVVNPAVILGTGDGSSGVIVPAIARGIRFYPDGVNGYVDVRDAARAMEQLSRCEQAVGERFVLCGANISYRELLTLGARVAGKRPPRRKLSRACAEILAAAARLFSPKLRNAWSRQVVRSLYGHYRYSGEKVKRYIDFEYTPVEKTIGRLVREYLQSDKRYA